MCLQPFSERLVRCFAVVSTVWSGEVIELPPLGQFGVQIDIARGAETLVELLLVVSVGLFDVSIELR